MSATRRHTLKNAFTSAAIVALCALLTGCFSLNPRSLRQMENALEESNPDMEIESTTKFGIGALTMDLVDFAFVHDSSIDISKISRADIGIYELKHALDLSDFKVPAGTSRNCPQREVIVRVNDEHERVEIAVCIRNGKITEFAVFSYDEREIVVVNCRGDFEALVSSAVRNPRGMRPGPGRGPGEAGDGAEPPGVHEHSDVHIQADAPAATPS